MPMTCRYCGGPLSEVTVEGRPKDSQLHCRDKACGHEWVDQNPRLSGPGTVQVGIGPEKIVRLQEGRSSQGEDNCEPIASITLAWLGDEFKLGQPCPVPGAKRDSTSERGFDFTVLAPCGHHVEIQVTRLVEREHFAALGKGEPVLDERAHVRLIELIDETVRRKAQATPPADRSKRILAIDGRDPSVGLNLFFANVKFVDMSEVFGWAGVLLVIDDRNTRFLDRDCWPTCHICGAGGSAQDSLCSSADPP